MSDLYSRLQSARGARLVVPILGAALLVVGLAAPAWYAVPALLVLLVGVGWLATQSPERGPGLVRIRMLVLGILVALLAGRLITAFV